MKERLAIISLMTTILILYGLQIKLTNDLAVTNVNYFKLEQQIQTLAKQNELLRSAILQQQSYTTILSEAKQMGFQEARYLVLR